MGKGSARLFRQTAPDALEQSWNVVELETRKQVRQRINTLLRLSDDMLVPTSEVRQQLLQCVATFGSLFTTQLVHALHCNEHTERQSVIWLLTVLNDKETIPPLRRMSANARLPRAIRLAAALALAGMGVTAEDFKQQRRDHLHIMS